MPLRRAGTVPNTGVRYGPGSAAHRFAKSYALRCVRGTPSMKIPRARQDPDIARVADFLRGIVGVFAPVVIERRTHVFTGERPALGKFFEHTK